METGNVVQMFRNVTYIDVDMFIEKPRTPDRFLGPNIQRTLSSEMIVLNENA